MAVLKVETDITSITTSPTGRAVILVIMYVKIFKTGNFNIRVNSCACELFLWIKVS